MKNLILFSVIIFCSFSFQPKSDFRDLYSISLPKGSQKISRSQVPAERDTVSKFAMKMGIGGDFYKVDATTFMNLRAYINESPGFSPEHAKKITAMISGSQKSPLPKYSTNLKTINNYTVLIETFALQNNMYYRFYSKSILAPYFLSGLIEFKERDKEKVIAMIDEMLKGLKFKNESYVPPKPLKLPEVKVKPK